MFLSDGILFASAGEIKPLRAVFRRRIRRLIRAGLQTKPGPLEDERELQAKMGSIPG